MQGNDLPFFYITERSLVSKDPIHTIQKSSKMDGAKYIPNFAFK
jgi:hypothetical protein